MGRHQPVSPSASLLCVVPRATSWCPAKQPHRWTSRHRWTYRATDSLGKCVHVETRQGRKAPTHRCSATSPCSPTNNATMPIPATLSRTLPSKAGHTKAVKHLYLNAQHPHSAHTAPTPRWDHAAVPHAVTRHSYKHTSL